MLEGLRKAIKTFVVVRAKGDIEAQTSAQFSFLVVSDHPYKKIWRIDNGFPFTKNIIRIYCLIHYNTKSKCKGTKMAVNITIITKNIKSQIDNITI